MPTGWCAAGREGGLAANYRGGSFLLPDDAEVSREANIRGVAIEPISGSDEAQIMATIENENMEKVVLEKAPKIAVYVPPTAQPWDDAVRLALEYAQIPYDRVWDEEVLRGDLAKYDWIHLHHEDFTGQQGKFYAAYRDFDWYKAEKAAQSDGSHGFAKVGQPPSRRWREDQDVARGGFLFAMCSACGQLRHRARAGRGHRRRALRRRPPRRPVQARFLEVSRVPELQPDQDPYIYEFSDIDRRSRPAARPNSVFALFEFSARTIRGLLMLTTLKRCPVHGSFKKSRLSWASRVPSFRRRRPAG